MSGALPRVQKVLQQRSPSSTSRPYGKIPSLFTGLLFCSCGARMVATTANWNKRTSYMRCNNRLRNGIEACGLPMTPISLLEKQVMAYLGTMLVPEDWSQEVFEELEAASSSGSTVDARDVERDLRTLMKRFLQHEIDEVTFQEEAARLRGGREEVRVAPSVRPNLGVVVGALQDVAKLWRNAPHDDQRTLLLQVFDRVVTHGRQLAHIVPKPNLAPRFTADRVRRFRQDGPTYPMCDMVPPAGVEPARMV